MTNSLTSRIKTSAVMPVIAGVATTSPSNSLPLDNSTLNLKTSKLSIERNAV